MKARNKIRNLKINQDNDGKISDISFVFGPHHFLEVSLDKDKVKLKLGATHHGFEINGSDIGGDLDKLIWDIRSNHHDKIELID